MLQGKPMLCWLYDEYGYEVFSTNNRETVQYRMQLLEEVTFNDIPQSWPPAAEDRYRHRRTFLWQMPHLNSHLAEGATEEGFHGPCDTPEAIRQRFWPNQGSAGKICHANLEPNLVAAYIDWSLLLRTTESSCRKATRNEEQQFYASTSASDADNFDMYLTFTKYPTDPKGRFYVFLDPIRHRFTGRIKDTAAPPQLGMVAAAADHPQFTSSTDLGDA